MESTPRWTHRPTGSTWGDFGLDDELGRLNLLTPEKVLQGIAEVSNGRTFCLSLPLDLPGGTGLSLTRKRPELRPTLRANGAIQMNYALRCDDPTAPDIVCDDQVLLTLQYSTQWDSLAHIGQMFDVHGDGNPLDVYYNGYRAGTDIVGPRDDDGCGPARPGGGQVGARRLGVENMARACIQGRGVMVDLEAHFGRTGKIVGYQDLMGVLDRDRVEVQPGDIVLLRTGLGQMIVDLRENLTRDVMGTVAALDGADERLQEWITGTGLVALVSDNFAVEVLPARRPAGGPTLPLHAHCLFRLGVYLGELWYLTELADWLRANGRSRFLLTAPPLRLPGAVGSPVSPVATV